MQMKNSGYLYDSQLDTIYDKITFYVDNCDYFPIHKLKICSGCSKELSH